MDSMISERQAKILDYIIEEYINTAMPVSSGRVFDIDDMGVSCPTIRNEMADLTDFGYLEQPHIAAGRVPTEKGYRFFVDKVLEKHREEINRERQEAARGIDDIKSLADSISRQVKSAVVFANEYGELKFFGLKRVFENPEFSSRQDIVSFIEEIEGLEGSIERILATVGDHLEVFIGSENPFFECAEYGMVSRMIDDIFISAVGPMRMNYQKSIKIFEDLI